VQGLEQERDAIEKKYEELLEKHNSTKAELDEMIKQLDSL
jgi:tropomyosin